MLNKVFGTDGSIGALKNELDASTQAVRDIAHRVANSSTPGFQGVLEDALEGDMIGEEVDLEGEMVALADEQLRYEAATSILSKLYQQVRSSIREG